MVEGDETDTLIQTANFRHVFVNNGADATVGYDNAGLGGTYSTSSNGTNTYPTISGTGTTITDHLQMSGLSGGNYGLSGQGDTVAQGHATISPHGSFTTTISSGDYKLREAGSAGYIVYGSTQVLTGGAAGDGTYAGDVSNITVS